MYTVWPTKGRAGVAGHHMHPLAHKDSFWILNLGMLLTMIVYQSYASLFLFNIKLSIYVCSVADWGSRRGYRSSDAPACTQGFFFNLELKNVTDNNCVSVICIIISVQYQIKYPCVQRCRLRVAQGSPVITCTHLHTRTLFQFWIVRML